MKKLIDQESMSFSTLIKVGVIEKTEDLNYLVPKLDSSANSCSVTSVENNAKNLEESVQYYSFEGLHQQSCFINE